MTIQRLDELEALQAAGNLAARALAAMRDALRPGLTTAQVDEVGRELLEREGARSAPQLVYGFPGWSCISVNDEIVHGIPGNRRLEPGDLVKLDVTIEKDGFMADTATTVQLAPRSSLGARLASCARAAFRRGIEAARPGAPVRRIGAAVEAEVLRHGFSVVRELSGHGIGRTIHEPPTVPNFDDVHSREILRDGMVITIEPLIAAGGEESTLDRDGWTVRTADRSLAAHFEHTLVVRRGGALVLTS
jgi:methionyl aminopeptidase